MRGLDRDRCHACQLMACAVIDMSRVGRVEEGVVGAILVYIFRPVVLATTHSRRMDRRGVGSEHAPVYPHACRSSPCVTCGADIRSSLITHTHTHMYKM